MLVCFQLVAKVGDTVEPGTKIAVISKSGGVTHVAPSEEKPSKAVSELSTARTKKVDMEKPKAETPPPKSETPPIKDKPKAPSLPPSKPSAKEPQLPPKERERRVSIIGCLFSTRNLF